jgi:hypothetical protein
VDSEAATRDGRLLGLDVGSRTIGMAVSDPLGITAQGLATVRRKNKRTDFAALERVIQEFGIAEIVVGYPLRLSGATGTQSEKMAAFAGPPVGRAAHLGRGQPSAARDGHEHPPARRGRRPLSGGADPAGLHGTPQVEALTNCSTWNNC